ncbi:hypothetical protein Mapa_002480 [Marchantia paleacea]|nr:hypothetical protein Mapa_002480 [Marchantia paleacea]
MATYVKGASQVSLALQVLMGLAFLWWWMFWFLQPIQTARNWLRKADAHISQDFLGTRGSTWLLQVLPFMVIAFLSYFAIVLKGKIKPSARDGSADQKPKVNIWSQPIILRSPLGMLTLADIVFLLVNVFVIAFYLIKMSVDRSKLIDNAKPKKGDHSKCAEIGEYWSVPGQGGADSLRSSLDSSFKRIAISARYWCSIRACCQIPYMAGPAVRLDPYCSRDSILCVLPSIHHTSELWRWQSKGIAFFPGIIALAAGLLMLATALERVRRNHFNVFFLTHHLYFVFLLFFLFHCVSQMVYVVTPILLFFLDRFIRLVQSRKSVDILSTKVLPSGAIELKFAKPGNLEYNALSFMYVLVPSISKFEWHPFSVASSPLDETNQICIYIKPLGSYTKDVHDALIDTKHHKEAGKLKCPFGFQLHLKDHTATSPTSISSEYNSLILVAGGIGVTPFLAILRDVLHRHKLHQENLPSSIQIVFCVRNQKDLYLLDTINPSEILPNYEDLVQIRVHAFVTSKVDLIKDEEVNSSEAIVPYQHYNYTYMNEPSKQYAGPPLEAVREMSILAGAGDNKWVAATFFATMIGYIVIFGIINVTGAYAKLTNYNRAMLYCVVLFLSVVCCGGSVLLLWAHSQKRKSPQSNAQVLANSSPPSPQKDSKASEGDIELRASEHTSWEGEVSLGKRPDWKVLFEDMARQYEGKNVGVLVSGASKMQEDVATECKNHTNFNNSNVAFHYHSVSFEL